MTRRWVAIGLLVLVAFAGCLTGQPATPEPVENPGVDLPYDDRTIGDPPYDPYDNPWSTDEIVVVVEDRAGMERNIAPDVMRTLSFWEETAGEEAAYDPEYRLLADHPEPDIRVEVVRTVDRCPVHEDYVALGCAPTLTADSTVDETATVQVRSGHAPATMTAILKHEIGHTLGYGHGEDAPAVMSHNLSARAPTDIRDAADRRYPWASETLEVSVAAGDELTDARERRLRTALRFFERGADHTIADPPDIEMVADADEADVVVSFRERVGSCDVSGPAASCVDWRGPSVDSDPQPEYYTDARVVVGSEGHDRPGWHVGYWLGQSLWTTSVPQPFYGQGKPPATTW
jgi:hypothetical protein